MRFNVNQAPDNNVRSRTANRALGGAVVMLVWMWISAHALLLGAEIDSILDRHGGAEGAFRWPGRGGERAGDT